MCTKPHNLNSKSSEPVQQLYMAKQIKVRNVTTFTSAELVSVFALRSPSMVILSNHKGERKGDLPCQNIIKIMLKMTKMSKTEICKKCCYP